MSRSLAIFDPQFITRQGIQRLAEESQLFDQITLLGTEQALTESISQVAPNFLMIDYAGPHQVHSAALKSLKTDFPGLKTLIISEDNDKSQIQKMLKAGVRGFVTKSCSEQEIVEAINTIQNGGKFFCKKVLNIVNSGEDFTNLELSEREMEIVKLVANGKSSAQIADSLNISVHTVNSHRKNILKKLGLKSPAELIIYASEMGWVKLAD